MDTPQEKGKKGGTTKWFLLLLLLAASVGGNIMQLAQKTPPTTPPLPLPSPTAKPAPDPAAEYLTAAQAAKEASKPEEAMALYEAALARSKDKTAILTEMTALTKEQIEQDLKAEDAAGRECAQGRLARLKAVCEAAVAAGSVADITGAPALQQQISELANLIPAEPQVVEEPAPAPDPAAEYLAAAQAATDPDVAMALYEAALAHSADKLSVLDQMTKWTEAQIKKDLQNKDSAAGRSLAQGRLALLASAYETAVSGGAVAEIKKIPELKKQLAKVAKLIPSEAPAVSSDPAEEYLAAAREAKNDQDMALDLYKAAILRSTNKSAILVEMTAWMKELINQDLKDKNAAGRERAQERLAHLELVYETVVTSGSVSDIKGKADLRNQLDEVSKLVSDEEKAALAFQKTTLDSVREELKQVKTTAKAKELVNKLEAIDWDSSVEDDKDLLLAEIVAKQSCLTAPTEELIIPEINDSTPWVAWLDHFADRLKANIPVGRPLEQKLTDLEQRLEDLGNATAFLEEAAQRRKPGSAIDEKLKKVEEATRWLNVEHWQARVSKATTDDQQNSSQDEQARMATISALLMEGESFSTSDKVKCSDQIRELNRLVLEASLKEMKRDLSQLKELDGKVPESSYIQMLGARQSQYLQMLSRIQELNSRFPYQFIDEKNEVSSQVAELENLIDAKRQMPVLRVDNRLEEQKRRFRDWAEDQLSEARELYGQAEELAGEWFKTWDSDETQAKLKEAWDTMIIIYPYDLDTVSPSLKENYDKLKGEIESQRAPSEEERKNVRYRRIKDM